MREGRRTRTWAEAKTASANVDTDKAARGSVPVVLRAAYERVGEVNLMEAFACAATAR